MKRYTVTGIKYDTDGAKVDLPERLEIDVDEDRLLTESIEDILSDEISNITGFCHFGFNIEDEQPEKKMFIVDVTRSSHSTKSFKVMATDEQQAKDIALDHAGSYEFSEHDAEYTAGDTIEVAPEHLGMYHFSEDLTKEQ